MNDISFAHILFATACPGSRALWAGFFTPPLTSPRAMIDRIHMLIGLPPFLVGKFPVAHDKERGLLRLLGALAGEYLGGERLQDRRVHVLDGKLIDPQRPEALRVGGATP